MKTWREEKSLEITVYRFKIYGTKTWGGGVVFIFAQNWIKRWAFVNPERTSKLHKRRYNF
jgi:hypothetical protein